MTPARYLTLSAALVGSALLAALALNLVIDPYSQNDRLRIQGINAVKPEFGTHTRQGKAFAVSNRAPDALVLGSSRAEVGIDPRAVRWSPGVERPYNLGLPSATVGEMLAYLQHALAVGPVREVLIGVDFFMFNAHKRAAPDYDASILLVKGGLSERANILGHQARTALSLATLKASASTILGQRSAIPEYDELGARHASYQESVVRRQGSHREAARLTERSFATEVYFPMPEGRFALRLPGKPGPFDEFGALLGLAVGSGARVTVFISPEHVRQLEVIRAVGLWDQYEQWKRGLVETVGAANARAAAGREVVLWDFSGYNAITTEPFPEPGDRSATMRWYWESSHYRREVGALMLARMGGGETGAGPGAEFGLRLDRAVVDRHLDSVRNAQIEFHRRSPPVVAEVESIACSLRPRCMRSPWIGPTEIVRPAANEPRDAAPNTRVPADADAVSRVADHHSNPTKAERRK